MSSPIIEPKLWQKAVALNPAMKTAVMNPNTDFMTKLLFDARQLHKQKGGEIAYWSNQIFKAKFALHEKDKLTPKEIAKKIGGGEEETKEILSYLKTMAEVLEEKGKYSLNYSNSFSAPFKG